jgi:hypothetical protein
MTIESLPSHIQGLHRTVAALPPEFWHWLDLLSTHEVPAPMRAHLREYHALPKDKKTLTADLLFELSLFPCEEAPAKIQPHLGSISEAMATVLATECPVRVEDGKIVATNSRTGNRFVF